MSWSDEPILSDQIKFKKYVLKIQLIRSADFIRSDYPFLSACTSFYCFIWFLSFEEMKKIKILYIIQSSIFTVQIIWPIKVLSKMLYNYMCNIYNDLLHALMLCVVSGHLLDWHIALITWISNSFMCWGFVSSEVSCLSE